jgi:hypothetical protein
VTPTEPPTLNIWEVDPKSVVLVMYGRRHTLAEVVQMLRALDHSESAIQWAIHRMIERGQFTPYWNPSHVN